MLLGYDQFQFIKVLFKNRWTVLYCTLLARTENEKEREKIESEMKADPEKAAVLKVCGGGGGGEYIVGRDRGRRDRGKGVGSRHFLKRQLNLKFKFKLRCVGSKL